MTMTKLEVVDWSVCCSIKDCGLEVDRASAPFPANLDRSKT
jgi:hypothetical protein